jgi:phage terminase Nu1 subunit (DNA packaging protein)
MKIPTFSIHAAAEILERDRGTVARAMRGVRADGEKGGTPRFRLATIIAALVERERNSANPSSGRTNLANERALLAREQKLMVARKNAIARGEYVEVAKIVRSLEHMFSVIKENFLGLPGTVSDTCARGDPEMRDFIAGVIREKVIEILKNVADPQTFVDALEPQPGDVTDYANPPGNGDSAAGGEP